MSELGKNIGLSGQCFPVRSLMRHSTRTDIKNTGGAWLVAYKAEQRRRFKAVLCRDPDVDLSGKSSVSKQSLKSDKTYEEEKRKKLDGFYLMSLLHVNDPLDLCSIDISGKDLNKVNEADFPLFKNIMHVDAGENNLKLMNFNGFPSLRELELPLNGLGGDISIKENDFLALELLDLSCNNLTNNDILALGILPALKSLHLTGNHLTQLPKEMSKSYLVDEGHRKTRFLKLEKLWLDQNDLIANNTFSSLAGLKRLKYLNLENNKIFGVPHLKLAEPKANYNVNLDSSFMMSDDLSLVEDDLNLRVAGTSVDEVLDNELKDVTNKISTLQEILYNGNKNLNKTSGVVHDETFVYFQDSQQLPFLSLEHLNLANNCIEEEEGLLALSTWPTLKELVIWGNPVASCGKEGPSIVGYHLGRLAGIEVSRHKPSPKPKNVTSLKLSKNPRKVDDLPPVSHNRKHLMLDGPKYPEILCEEVRPLPPITADENRQEMGPAKRSSSAPAKQETVTNSQSIFKQRSRESAQRQGALSPEDRVFLTQIDDNDEVLFFDNDEPQQNTNETFVEHGNSKPVPLKYQGYEELINIDDDYQDHIKLPEDIHGNVTALQYTLDHPLIFTDQSSRPRARTKNKHKVVSTKKTSCTNPVEELGMVLDKMRTHSKTVESNLGDVLSDSKSLQSQKEFKEAKKLLNEVQTKYNEVRCESLRSTSIATDMVPNLTSASSSLQQHQNKQNSYQKTDKIKSSKDLEMFKTMGSRM